MDWHSQTPWDARPIEHGKAIILGAPDGFCSSVVGTIHSPYDARRIVAAVNATADIPVEALEAGVVAKLVEALKEARTELWNALDHLAPERDPDEALSIKDIDAAIGLVEPDWNDAAIEEQSA